MLLQGAANQGMGAGGGWLAEDAPCRLGQAALGRAGRWAAGAQRGGCSSRDARVKLPHGAVLSCRPEEVRIERLHGHVLHRLTQ